MVETAMIDYTGGKGNRKRIEKEEEELKKLLENPADQDEEEEKEDAPTATSTEETDEGPEPKTEEERVWKKRHGDLRRHTQKEIDSLKNQINALTERLEKEKKNPSIPEERLNEVAEKNPVIVALIEKRAKEIADNMFQETNQKFEALSQREEELLKEKNEMSIRAKHKDYDDIVSSDDFHSWAGPQSWLQDIVYNDDYYKNPEAIVNVLNLYKLDRGMTPAAKEEKRKMAQESVSTKSKVSVPEDNNPKQMKESYFSSREFNKLPLAKQEEMLNKWKEAVQNGDAIFDLSGK